MVAFKAAFTLAGTVPVTEMAKNLSNITFQSEIILTRLDLRRLDFCAYDDCNFNLFKSKFKKCNQPVCLSIEI